MAVEDPPTAELDTDVMEALAMEFGDEVGEVGGQAAAANGMDIDESDEGDADADEVETRSTVSGGVGANHQLALSTPGRKSGNALSLIVPPSTPAGSEADLCVSPGTPGGNGPSSFPMNGLPLCHQTVCGCAICKRKSNMDTNHIICSPYLIVNPFHHNSRIALILILFGNIVRSVWVISILFKYEA